MFLMIDIGFFALVFLVSVAYSFLGRSDSATQATANESQELQAPSTYNSQYADVSLDDAEHDETIDGMHSREIELREYQATLEYSYKIQSLKRRTDRDIVFCSLLSAVIMLYIICRNWRRHETA